MTLKDLARYAEVSARSKSRTVGDEGSRAAARLILAQMEQEHPGIASAAERAERAMLDPFAGAAPPPGPGGPSIKDVLTGLGIGAATRFANGFGAELLDEARRMEPLSRGEVTVKRHECAPDHVCVEVRHRARDWSAAKRAILRAVESELADAVEDADPR